MKVYPLTPLLVTALVQAAAHQLARRVAPLAPANCGFITVSDVFMTYGIRLKPEDTAGEAVLFGRDDPTWYARVGGRWTEHYRSFHRRPSAARLAKSNRENTGWASLPAGKAGDGVGLTAQEMR